MADVAIRASRCPTCGEFVLGLCDHAGIGLTTIVPIHIGCKPRAKPLRDGTSVDPQLELVERAATDEQAAATRLSSGFFADFDGPSPKPTTQGETRMRAGHISDKAVTIAWETSAPEDVRLREGYVLNAAVEAFAPECLNGTHWGVEGDARNHLPPAAVAKIRATFELLLQGLDAAEKDPKCREPRKRAKAKAKKRAAKKGARRSR